MKLTVETIIEQYHGGVMATLSDGVNRVILSGPAAGAPKIGEVYDLELTKVVTEEVPPADAPSSAPKVPAGTSAELGTLSTGTNAS
jgi:hypothetical protein